MTTEEKEVFNRFVSKMRQELENNSHKGNFITFTDINKILFELEYHKAKLYMSLSDWINDGNDNAKAECLEYLADIANISMMLHNAILNNNN